MYKGQVSRFTIRRIKANAPEIATLLIVFMITLLTVHEVREHSHGYNLHKRPNIAAVLRDQKLEPETAEVMPSPSPSPVKESCHAIPHSEFQGNIVKEGSSNSADSAAACCSQCEMTKGCNIWVWCSEPGGCGPGQGYKECWLKTSTLSYVLQAEGFTDQRLGWTSGSVFPKAERAAVVNAEKKRLLALRRDKQLPLVFFDVAIKGVHVGRIEMILFADIAPLAAENFRALCTGEKGIVPVGHEGAGRPYHFKGSTFYRIVDHFICQSGAQVESIFGGSFRDDPKALSLKHDRRGLLSMANNGPDSNTAHFSILMAPAPHLDGKNVIFGEVVSVFVVVNNINALSSGKPENTVGPEEQVVIADCGEVKRR
jgi:peptidyl-prolyl isomerase D